MSSNGSNLGERSARMRQASLKHLWGWGQPLDLYSEQFWQGQDLSFSVCCRFSWWVSWIIKSKTVHTLWVFHRHLLVDLCSRFFAFVSFPGLNQARRMSLWSMQKFGESSVRLCLAPIFRMALRSWGSCLLVRHLHFRKVCRKMSVRVGPSGVGLDGCCWVHDRIISRAASDARGWEAEWLASFLSFITLIASL